MEGVPTLDDGCDVRLPVVEVRADGALRPHGERSAGDAQTTLGGAEGNVTVHHVHLLFIQLNLSGNMKIFLSLN